MDGERSGPPAGQDGGYVPPDLVSTQRFWTIPPDRQAVAGQREDAETTLRDRLVAPVPSNEDVLVTRPRAHAPMSVPMAAAAPPRLPPPPARPRPVANETSPSVPASAAARKPRSSRHMAAAAVCAVGVVVIGAGVAALWPGDDSKPAAAKPGASQPAASGDGTSTSTSSASASAPARTQRGAPSPTGIASGQAAPATAAQPFTQGRVVSYATTQREQGYFEGLLTLTNRTGAPMTGWQLTVTYPGAYIKSVWGGVLVQAGTTATIRGGAAAGSIPVGGTVQVRFGAAGTPSAPAGCTLNGGPC